ncbi:MAG: MBL fold metallo-hydrolase [Candidatus Jordarchaeum sp.]|uniref:MBL fold metallo-hydrolase n=1 Tax=Candidatus Jordarchaeum sp. TaxID=2823881 RepID=UPI0040499424
MCKVFYDRGLVIEVNNLKFLFDPKMNADFNSANLVLVSHGHKDHISGLVEASRGMRVGASRITHEITRLVREKREKKVLENIIYLEREFGIKTEEFSIEAYDAGHCMGSMQFKIDTGEHLIGYTGDINFCESVTERKADVMDCDVLVIEATFGSEEYVFPDREELNAEILDYVERNVSNGIPVILTGYSLGKCQELTRLISKGLGYDVLVSGQIFDFNNIFERYKSGLGKYLQIDSEEGKEVIEEGGGVILLPQFRLTKDAPDRLAKNFNLSTLPNIAVCTGWAINRSFFFAMQQAYNVDAAFPLSSHADFNQLLEYVAAVEPSQVYTTFGNPVNLAKQIRKKLKINAQPVVNRMQQTLDIYTVDQEPQIGTKPDNQEI